jgi:hypothetical protein
MMIQIFFVVLLITKNIHAMDPAQVLLNRHQAQPDQFLGKTEMHGFTMNDFFGFQDKWKLVTSRYRQDTHEMRLTYANEIAWDTLSKGETKYPDGALFAKIGFITAEDPAFPSSLVPSGAKRYQFMVKDKKKFSQTDGWAYVLFNGQGQTFTGNPKDNSMACAACHKVVKDKGFVFSEIMNVSPFDLKSQTNRPKLKVKSSQSQLQFLEEAVKDLPLDLKQMLPSESMNVRSLQGEMQKYLFEGTLNEITPLLAKETIKFRRAAVLISEDREQFSYAFIDPVQTRCKDSKISIVYGMTLLNPTMAKKTLTSGIEKVLKMGRYCH